MLIDDEREFLHDLSNQMTKLYGKVYKVALKTEEMTLEEIKKMSNESLEHLNSTLALIKNRKAKLLADK